MRNSPALDYVVARARKLVTYKERVTVAHTEKEDSFKVKQFRFTLFKEKYEA